MTNRTDNKAPIFAISRLRMATDGSGITTLVTFYQCPKTASFFDYVKLISEVIAA